MKELDEALMDILTNLWHRIEVEDSDYHYDAVLSALGEIKAIKGDGWGIALVREEAKLPDIHSMMGNLIYPDQAQQDMLNANFKQVIWQGDE